MQINPNVQVGIGVAVALLTLGSKGAIQLPIGVPTSWGPIVTSWSNFIMQIYVVIAPMLAAYSSSQPGWFAPKDSALTAAATKLQTSALVSDPATQNAAVQIIAAAAKTTSALLIGLLAFGALALISPQARAATASINLDPLNLAGRTTETQPLIQQGPLKALADWFAGDAPSAIALTKEFPTPPDGNGAACWAAGDKLNAIIKAHPNLLTGKAMTDMEALRLATMAARQACDNVACNTVATEFATGLKGLATALPISVNLPTQNIFVDACLHVPHIVSVPLPTPESIPALITGPTITPTTAQ